MRRNVRAQITHLTAKALQQPAAAFMGRLFPGQKNLRAVGANFAGTGEDGAVEIGNIMRLHPLGTFARFSWCAGTELNHRPAR